MSTRIRRPPKRKTARREWKPDREDALAALWQEGWYAAAIADALGVTLNAVVGKARRMRLAHRKRGPRPRSAHVGS